MIKKPAYANAINLSGSQSSATIALISAASVGGQIGFGLFVSLLFSVSYVVRLMDEKLE